MTRMLRSCIQSVLKMVNSLMGMFGIAFIIYSIWMIRSWHRHIHDFDHPAPWFIYAMLGLGAVFCVITCSGHIAAETANGCCLYFVSVVLMFIYAMLGLGAIFCVIACSGHIAAETANGCCLYFYLVFVVLLLMLEGAVTTDVFVNRNWEEDFPKDPSGNFNEFKDFINDNFQMCKWIGFSIVGVQGLSVFLALILKAFGPHQERQYDSDDDYTTLEAYPVLRNYVNQPSYVVGSPVYGTR